MIDCIHERPLDGSKQEDFIFCAEEMSIVHKKEYCGTEACPLKWVDEEGNEI